MADSTGQNYVIGISADVSGADAYVRALATIRDASARTTQELTQDSRAIGNALADMNAALAKSRGAAASQQRLSGATAGAGPATPTKQAAEEAARSTALYNDLLRQQAQAYPTVGKAATQYVDSLIRQRTVTREVREEVEALAAAEKAAAGATAAGGHPAWFGTGPVSPLGLKDTGKSLGVKNALLPTTTDPRTIVAVNQAFGARTDAVLKAAVAEKDFSFEVQKHLQAEVALSSGMGHVQQELVARNRITGELISGETKYAAALRQSEQAATASAMAQAKNAAIAQYNQAALQTKAASPLYTSGLAPKGGAGGGAGAGFLGGRGTLFEQIVSTARISALYGGMYTALFGLAGFLKQSIQSYSDFQLSIQTLADITGQSTTEVAAFASNIADIGAQFGVASDAAIRVASQTKGIDPNASNLAVKETVKAVSQTAMITGQSAEEISQAANAVAVAYGTSAKTVLDASIAMDRKLGVLQPTLGGQGRVAVLAEQAGISQAELSAMFSVLSARLNRSPEDIAGALGQVLSRTDIVDLTELGATAGKSFADQLKEVGNLAPGLTDSQLTAVANKFGRGSSGQTALELFKQMPDIVRRAGEPTEGRTSELAATRMRTFSGAMQLLQGSFEKLANTIGRTGIYTGLIAVALAAKTLAEVLNALLKPLLFIPGPIRDLGFAAAEAAAVLALLGRSAAIKAVAQGVAGSAAQSGSLVAIGASSVGLGLKRVGVALGSFLRGFGGTALAAGALTLEFATLRDIILTNDDAHSELNKALKDSSSSAEDLATAANQSADSLKEQSLINRTVLASQQEGMRNFADLAQSISQAQLEPQGVVAQAAGRLSSTNIDTSSVAAVFQQLVKDGGSAADALRAIVTAAATAGGGTIPGAKGGGYVERAKSLFTKMAGALEAGTFQDTGLHAGPVKVYPSRPIQLDLQKPGKLKIKEAEAELERQLSQNKVITKEDMDKYIDVILDAYEVPPDLRDYVRGKLEDMFNANKEGLSIGAILSDSVNAVVNKMNEEVKAGREGILANVKAAGKDLKFQPGEVTKVFQGLGKGDLGLIAGDSQVAALQSGINSLQEVRNQAAAAGDMTAYAEAAAQIAVTKKALADALIDPSIDLLKAAFGDLTTKDKSSAEIRTMIASITALIPKIAASSTAMASLVQLLDSRTRQLVRVKLASAVDVARAVAAGLSDTYLNELGKALKASPGGGRDPTQFVSSKAIAGLKSGMTAANQSVADALKSLEEFDKAMESTPVGTASEAGKAAKTPKEKAPKKTDTQAQIDAAKALAEATKVQDPVKIAAAQLQVAQADLAAVAAESGRNSVAYWNAMSGVYKAMQDLADAQVQASHQARLLGIDLTNPVQQAQAEYDLALAHYNSLKSQGASKNALNPAQVDVRTKEAALEAAKFQQVISSLQTNEQLKRISHQEYIRGLTAELDRLKAQQALLKTTSTGYQQLQDQIDQTEGLLQSATDSIDAMFNLGDIKLPTVYEVRRFMDSAFEGLNFLGTQGNQQLNPGAGGHTPVFLAAQGAGQTPTPAGGNVDNRNVVININGGDLAAVQAAVFDAAGTTTDQQIVGTRPAKV